MIHLIKYRKRGRNFLPLMIAGIILALAVPVLAADDGVVDDGYTTIKPIPGSEYEGVHDFRQDVEKNYDFIGTIDDVQKEGIVVGDSYMKFSPKAKLSGARPGARVGIVLNDAGEVVLCEPFTKPVSR